MWTHYQTFFLYKSSIWWLLASTWALGKGRSVEDDKVLHCVNCLIDNLFLSIWPPVDLAESPNVRYSGRTLKMLLVNSWLNKDAGSSPTPGQVSGPTYDNAAEGCSFQTSPPSGPGPWPRWLGDWLRHRPVTVSLPAGHRAVSDAASPHGAWSWPQPPGWQSRTCFIITDLADLNLRLPPWTVLLLCWGQVVCPGWWAFVLLARGPRQLLFPREQLALSAHCGETHTPTVETAVC